MLGKHTWCFVSVSIVHSTLTLTEPTAKNTIPNQCLTSAYTRGHEKGLDDVMQETLIYPRNCCDSVAYPQWLACTGHMVWVRGSWVQNRDKTSWLLFLLLSSFISISLPSHVRTPSTWGLRCVQFCLGLKHYKFGRSVAPTCSKCTF